MTHEQFEEFVREEMRKGFSLWWSSSEWQSGRPVTIREMATRIRQMAIAQDAFAEGWVRGAAVVMGLSPRVRETALESDRPALPSGDNA